MLVTIPSHFGKLSSSTCAYASIPANPFIVHPPQPETWILMTVSFVEPINGPTTTDAASICTYARCYCFLLPRVVPLTSRSIYRTFPRHVVNTFADWTRTRANRTLTHRHPHIHPTRKFLRWCLITNRAACGRLNHWGPLTTPREVQNAMIAIERRYANDWPTVLCGVDGSNHTTNNDIATPHTGDDDDDIQKVEFPLLLIQTPSSRRCCRKVERWRCV